MSAKVLVVDDKQMMRDSIGITLQRAGFTAVAAHDGETALKLMARHRPAAVVTDLKMPAMDGLELLDRIRRVDDQAPVVLMTAYGNIETAVSAMKRGAFDFIQKPFEGGQLVMTVKRAVEHCRLVQENAALRTNAHPLDSAPMLVGRSSVMRCVVQQVHQIARCHGTVMICGASGTGKEVVARAVHAHSPRRDNVMLCLNCAALSSSLLESELFGHEKGAFTGADQRRKGRFELADGGTLLLDEISEIPPQLQAKLLRVLQEQQFERVGSSTTMQVDVRVIATTNRDMGRAVADGSFRQDLFYRLNVLPLVLPPLHDRIEDLPLLSDHFLTRVAMREGRDPKRFDDAALEVMAQYQWPGNVRELENICERASVLTHGQVIHADTIIPWLPISQTPRIGIDANRFAVVPAPGPGVPSMASVEPVVVSDQMPGHAMPVAHDLAEGHYQPRPLADIEREQIVQTLRHFSGNRQQTARALGIGVRTLGLKLKKWKEEHLVAQTI